MLVQRGYFIFAMKIYLNLDSSKIILTTQPRFIQHHLST